MRRRARGCAIVVLLLLAWALPAWAQRTFYVQNGGPNNGCSQSSTAPQNNLSNAVGCLTQAGDTLYLLTNGTNNTFSCGNCLSPPGGGSGEGARKTIAGFDGTPNGGNRAVTINGTIHPIDSGQSFITYKNFRLNAAGQQFAVKIDGHSVSNYAHHITIDNVEIFGSDSHGIQIPGNQFGGHVTGFNRIVNSEIHHVGTDIRLEHGIYACSDDSVYDHVSIHDVCGCGFHIYCGDNPGASNNVVSNSLAYNMNKPYTHDNNGSLPPVSPTNGTPRGDGIGINCNGLGSNDSQAGAYSCATGFLFNGGGNGGGSVTAFNNRTHDNTGAYRVESGSLQVFSSTGVNNGQCFSLTNGDIRNSICQNSGGCAGSNCVTSAPLDNNQKLTSAIGGGQNLTGLGISGLTVDFEGTPRPGGSTAWDNGADQFGGPACGSCPTACTSAGKTCTIDPCVCDDQSAGQQDPIAWWKFDEASGTTATDSGNPGGKNATLVGGVTRTAGRVGTGAVTLDGTTGVITLPDAIMSTFGSNHTVCMWVQAVNPLAAIPTGSFKQDFLNILTPSGTEGLRSVIDELAFNTAPAGAWHVAVLTGGGLIPRALTTALTANTWTHLCHTYTSATQTIVLYRDGTVADSIAGDAFGPANDTALGARTRDQGSGVTGPLNGKLDEVKLWNRVLTATEITTEFTGAGSPPANKTPRHTKSLAAQ